MRPTFIPIMASVRWRHWAAMARRLRRWCSAITSGSTAAAITATQKVRISRPPPASLRPQKHSKPHGKRGHYRPGLSDAAAAAKLRGAVKEGKFCAEAVEAVLTCAGQPARRATAERLAGLTPREIEVLRLIAAGHTAKEAARQLEIAPKTADNHIQNLYSKIGVATRAGAALYALERGLVQQGMHGA